MPFGGGYFRGTPSSTLTWRKLADVTISGGAVTSVSITGLDLGAAKTYFLMCHLKNAGAVQATIYLEQNADTTLTNYYFEQFKADGGGITAGRANDPTIAVLAASTEVNFNAFMSQIAGVEPRTLSLSARAAPAAIIAQEMCHIHDDTTNVTSIQIISSVANAIDDGSTIRLYALD
mgnify:CR=1 FL=1|jgi:hypothetical protein